LPAYDGGRLFVLNGNGTLTALDAATGATLWSFQFPMYSAMFDSIPTAYGGILYTPIDGTLYAISEASGATLWTADIGSGDYSSPAVSSNGVYVAYAGPQVYDIDPLSGAQTWHYSGPVSGGGGETPVLFNGAIYAMDVVTQPVILGANTGQAIGTFASYRTPAFHGTQGFFVTSNSTTDFIEAQDLGAKTTHWTFPNVDGGGPVPNAQPMTSPLVVNGYVYAGFIYFGSSISAVAALDETTGELVWSDDTSMDTGDGEDFGTDYSLSAADGVLVVPAMNHVVAYASTPPLGDP
jgi:outer membrane protein assembly factor BamB